MLSIMYIISYKNRPCATNTRATIRISEEIQHFSKDIVSFSESSYTKFDVCVYVYYINGLTKGVSLCHYPKNGFIQ